jgi:hypothetical protein
MNMTEVLEQTAQDVEFARLRHEQMNNFQSLLADINNDIAHLKPLLAQLDESTETGSAQARAAIHSELRKLLGLEE